MSSQNYCVFEISFHGVSFEIRKSAVLNYPVARKKVGIHFPKYRRSAPPIRHEAKIQNSEWSGSTVAKLAPFQWCFNCRPLPTDVMLAKVEITVGIGDCTRESSWRKNSSKVFCKLVSLRLVWMVRFDRCYLCSKLEHKKESVGEYEGWIWRESRSYRVLLCTTQLRRVSGLYKNGRTQIDFMEAIGHLSASIGGENELGSILRTLSELLRLS